MFLRRLAAAALTAFVLPTAGTVAAMSAAPDQPPDRVVLPDTAAGLDEHYAAMRDEVAAELGAQRPRTDPERLASLRALARPARQLLHFDPSGDGRVVEVLGDLSAATRIAVLVPGADSRLETFDGRGEAPWAAVADAAAQLHAEVGREDPQARLAVIAWLGYDAPPPVSLDTITDRTARDGAARLRTLLAELRRINDADVALLCHSYGSVVCAQTADAPTVTDVVVYGSPGVGAGRARGVASHAEVWAGRGTRDWIRHVPHVRLTLADVHVGFGADPVAAEFGARVFDAGDAGHNDYFAPGSVSLANLAAIALDRGEGAADA